MSESFSPDVLYGRGDRRRFVRERSKWHTTEWRRGRRRGEKRGKFGDLGRCKVSYFLAVVDLQSCTESVGCLVSDAVECSQRLLVEYMSEKQKRFAIPNTYPCILQVWQKYSKDVHHLLTGPDKLESGEGQQQFDTPRRTHTFPTCQTNRIHTAEQSSMSTSQAEGRRQDDLVKQRLQNREEYERQKQNLINETEKSRPSANKFVGQNDSMEDTLKNSTIGLVHLEDFQQRRKALEEAKAREAARTNELK